MKEQFTLFYNGPFSQWKFATMTIDGIAYNCCEQYMMSKKAIVFKDELTLNKIMDSNSPREQKSLGKTVKNFDKEQWEAVAKDIVYRGNIAKFTQNNDLAIELSKTAGTTLVEASPYDRIWGIGLGENDPKALDREQWLGTNWLGEIITQVRNDILGN